MADLLPQPLVSEGGLSVSDGLVGEEGVLSLVSPKRWSPAPSTTGRSQLVDEVVLDQRPPELIAGRDDDFSV
jgi:hypothetical protein